MEKNFRNKKCYFLFYILCGNFSKIGPIIKEIPKFWDDPLNHSFLGYDTWVYFLNKHYYKSKKGILISKNSHRIIFVGIICVQMAVLTNITIILKKGVIIGWALLELFVCINFGKFRSVVFEILMKISMKKTK